MTYLQFVNMVAIVRDLLSYRLTSHQVLDKIDDVVSNF